MSATSSVRAPPPPPAADSWVAQVLLDTVATAQAVAIRAVHRDEAESFFAARVRPNVDAGMSEEAFWREVEAIAADPRDGLRRLVDERRFWRKVLTTDPSARLWRLRPAYSSPLLLLLREFPPWAWWESLWCLDRARRRLLRGGAEAGRPRWGGMFGDDLLLADRLLPGSDALLLVAGPVWPARAAASMPDTDRRGRAEALIGELGATLGPWRQGRQTPKWSPDRLRRAALHRPGLVPDDLDGRLEEAADALAATLPIGDWEAAAGGARLPAAHVEAAAQAALFLRRIAGAAALRGAGRIAYHLPPVALDDGGRTAPRWFLITASSDGGAPGDVLPPAVVDEPPADAARLSLDPALASPGLAGLAPRLSRFLAEAATGESAFVLERFKLVRHWLRDNFGRPPGRGGGGGETYDDIARRSFEDVAAQLAKRLALMFNADRCNIYRYDAGERALLRLGHFAAGPAVDDAGGRGVAARMRAAGGDKGDRERSVCYRTIDEGKRVFLREARPQDFLIEEDPPARCALTVPLSVFGRPWGLVELKGRRPHQLPESADRWVEAITRLIGPHFYHEWFLWQIQDLHQEIMAVPARPEGRMAAVEPPKSRQSVAADKFKRLAEGIARMFMASSAALYLRQELWPDDFDAVGWYQRPDLEDHPAYRTYDWSADDSITARTVREAEERGNRLPWLAGTIGEPPFDGPWQDKPKIRILKEDGHKHIAMIILREPGPGGRVTGSITLTAREPRGFLPNFDHLMRFLARHASLLIAAVESRKREDIVDRQIIAHSVKNSMSKVEGSSKQITDGLAYFLGPAGQAALAAQLAKGMQRLVREPGALAKLGVTADPVLVVEALDQLERLFGEKGRDQLGKTLGDLIRSAGDVADTAAYISGSPSKYDPLQVTGGRWDGTPTSLRQAVLGCLKPLRDRVRSREEPVVPIGREVRVHVADRLLREVLGNLFDNAVKHSPDRSYPLLRLRGPGEGGLVLQVRNLGPALDPGEDRRIFESGYRGRHAREVRPVQGEGQGLYAASLLAVRAGMRLVYRADPASGGGEVHV